MGILISLTEDSSAIIYQIAEEFGITPTEVFDKLIEAAGNVLKLPKIEDYWEARVLKVVDFFGSGKFTTKGVYFRMGYDSRNFSRKDDMRISKILLANGYIKTRIGNRRAYMRAP